MNKYYYNTLVLSGGSIKAISMLGSIQYCCDNNLLDGVNTYMGTSAGAILNYLLCIGYTPVEIIIYLCTHNIFEAVQFLDVVSMMNGGGAIGFSKFQEHLEKMTIDKVGRLMTFKDIKDLFNKTLIITTYNYTEQKVEYLSPTDTPDLPCLIALRMTSCLPLIFEPFKYNGNQYLDGAFGDNFPILYNLDDEKENSVKSHRLGITVDGYDEKTEDAVLEPNKLIEYLYKLITIPLKQNIAKNLEAAKHMDVIHIRNNIGVFNYRLTSKEKMELFSVGYQLASDFFN